MYSSSPRGHLERSGNIARVIKRFPAKRLSGSARIRSHLTLVECIGLAQLTIRHLLFYNLTQVLPGPPSSANLLTMLGPISSYSAFV